VSDGGAADAASSSRRPRRLGVIGSLVWDRIHGRDPRDMPVDEWGGISYSLAALDAALPDDWQIVPVIKVGNDLAAHARRHLTSLRRLASDAALVEVPFPTSRVELHYLSAERRTERMSGGVPPWSWLALQPLLRDLDALYINFISGFELELETAQLIRQHFRGPIYCDVHSLLLAVQPSGLRTPRPLENVPAWCRCFDLMQLNEDELSMMAPDAMGLAATAMANGVRSLVVTLGARGVVYFASAGFDGLESRRARALNDAGGAIRTAILPAVPPRDPESIDPTGCGDVFGATYYSRLLAGDKLTAALSAALIAAGRNLEHRGAGGLAHHLRGELSQA
jgi:hypothetical protein